MKGPFRHSPPLKTKWPFRNNLLLLLKTKEPLRHKLLLLLRLSFGFGLLLLLLLFFLKIKGPFKVNMPPAIPLLRVCLTATTRKNRSGSGKTAASSAEEPLTTTGNTASVNATIVGNI
ncbi:DNA methyltransferase 1-associated protein DMAP0 [Lasiodiplodia theobromae]|uniref:DNA methyltransferase 1-associated protein DMAP0 n=1 Tax=Lasiodiplodia theobromae TaxID=45133 RepID=UPI0015C3DEC5|nr:DNA methyltransferase 1-associated protein DMAP0 [Lasiodiplodia theobromae]KAF4545986.1 DNA methyltransferase 1-associated protein DMAP0 [Lasiodiplodia theobromae]